MPEGPQRERLDWKDLGKYASDGDDPRTVPLSPDRSGRSPSTELGNFYYWGMARLADGVTPAPRPVTNAAQRSISTRRWSNRSLRA